MGTSRVIAIVRHGETDWNLEQRIQGRTEVPLNDTGRAQAQQTGLLLASDATREALGPLERVTSSPLGRARETAATIAQTASLPQTAVEPELLERHFGPAEGLLVTEAHRRWPGLAVPGAESLDQLAERAAGAFLRTLDEAPGTILVAHGALIRAGLSLLSGAELPRILNGEVWVLRGGSAAEVFRYPTASSEPLHR